MTTPGDPYSSPEPPSGYGPPPGWGAPPPQQAYGTPQGWGPPAGYGQPAGPSSDDTTWAVLAHLSYFVAGLIAPLVIFLVKKDSPFARQQAAEAFNFHLTLLLAAIVSGVLVLVIIGIFMLLAVFLGGAVLSVVAAVRSGRGESYRYPLTIRFLN
jgi:uncharacterized Tic20 family protein